MRIKSTHPESQGPFVEIDDDQFDESKHELYVEDEAPAAPAIPDAPVPDAPVVDEPAAPAAPVETVAAPPQPWAKPAK